MNWLPAIPAAELLGRADGEPSAQVAARVAQARVRQVARQGVPNAVIEAGQIDALCVLDEAAARFVRSAAEKLGWSGRRLHRCLKVARTIADLAGSETIGVGHASEALQLQRAIGLS